MLSKGHEARCNRVLMIIALTLPMLSCIPRAGGPPGSRTGRAAGEVDLDEK